MQPWNLNHQLRPVLLLAHAYSPENLVGAYRPTRFVRYLPDFCYEPWVVTASLQPDPAPDRVLCVPYRFDLLERVLAKTLFPHDDRMNWIRAAEAATAAWIPKLPSSPILFSTSPPQASHWVAANLARKFRLPWVADFRDPLVANFGRNTKLGRIVDRYLERRVVAGANVVLMNTDSAAVELRNRYPGVRARIDSIPNGYDPGDQFGPLPIPKRTRRVWFHGGSIYLNRYPIRLLDCLFGLLREGRIGNDWKIRMLGTVEETALFSLPSYVELNRLGHIDCHPDLLPKEIALKEASEADATIVFDHFHSTGVNLAIPAKSFDCVRASRPILVFTSRGAPLDTMISRCGVPNVRIYEDDTAELMKTKLVEFSKLPASPTTPSAWFEEMYSAPQQTARLASIFDSLEGMVT